MSAIISSCGLYRYQLERGQLPRLAFIMLNPSTADATQDDPTIRRCMGFAKRFKCDGIEVMNLYALRATNPKDLWTATDCVGPENDAHLIDLAQRHRIGIIAWGNNAQAGRADDVIRLLTANGMSLYAMGWTKSKQPRHPLYLPADVPVELFKRATQ